MLVQLSGVPGSGKSALARSMAAATGLVVIDTDVLKSSLIGSGVSVTAAGAVTYAAALALARDLLEQGRNVVLDSPCRYEALLDSGQAAARACGARYAFIELWVADWSVVLDRLDQRSARPSQVASATEPVPGTSWENGTAETTLPGVAGAARASGHGQSAAVCGEHARAQRGRGARVPRTSLTRCRPQPTGPDHR